MAEITREMVVESLTQVNDPDLKNNLVNLNSVKDIQIEAGNIKVTIELQNPEGENAEAVKAQCEAVIRSVAPDAGAVIVKSVQKVTSTNQTGPYEIMPGVKHTIAVASGKGGVGKSTVAANLAVALAKDGAKVGLIDADIYGPSIPLMFGVGNKPKVYQSSFSNKMLPLEAHGVKLMSIGFLIEDNQAVIWRGPMASGAVKQFMSDVDWEELDYLIFDLPPGTGDIQLTLVQTIPLSGAVIVTTPQDVALIDAKKGLKMFERVNVPVFGIVENMSYFVAPDTGKRYDIFGTGGGERLAAELETTFLGGIPIDPAIREGGDNGKPIVAQYPDSEHAAAFSQIGKNLAEQININNKNNGPDLEIDLG